MEGNIELRPRGAASAWPICGYDCVHFSQACKMFHSESNQQYLRTVTKCLLLLKANLLTFTAGLRKQKYVQILWERVLFWWLLYKLRSRMHVCTTVCELGPCCQCCSLSVAEHTVFAVQYSMLSACQGKDNVLYVQCVAEPCRDVWKVETRYWKCVTCYILCRRPAVSCR